MRHYSAILPAWALFILVPLAQAHVRIEQPVPYGNPPPNTNPLEQDGSDYPCKYSQAPGSLYMNWDVVQWNVMAIGSPQPLSFQGQATHGGGACQISLTKDLPPTKDSVFKVIKSIEGGCPSTNPGNVGTDPTGYGADKFQYTIPNEIAPANYTLAWSWFNKDGNREMYMNCAPITVTAGQSSGGGKRHLHERRLHERRHLMPEQRAADGFDSLPDMFRANSGNGCTSPASGDVLAIPQANLGSTVQRIGSEPLVAPVGTCGGQDPGSGGPEQAKDAASSATTSAPASSAVATSTPASSAVATSAPLAPATTPTAVVSSAAVAPSKAPAGAQGANMGSCPTPGKSVCSPDGKGWGTCMETLQVIYQPIAEGTKCDASLGVEVPLV